MGAIKFMHIVYMQYANFFQKGFFLSFFLELFFFEKASKNKYTSSSSSTYVSSNGSFSITYGDGSTTSGTYVYDTVTIASLAVTSQKFAQTVSALTGNFDVEFFKRKISI